MSIENLHLITIPFSGRHTGYAMFEMFTKLFDALCPLWRDKLIGCSTDGAANMTGHLSGVVTRIEAVVRPNFVRVWCLLHQIDIVMQKVYKNDWLRIVQVPHVLDFVSTSSKDSDRSDGCCLSNSICDSLGVDVKGRTLYD